MNKTVTDAHAIYREKVKSEKSLKAVKRKLSDEVFEAGEDFGLDSALRFKKSYCQEVSDRLRKKKKEGTDIDTIQLDTTTNEPSTKEQTTFSQIGR